jgi:hypothetical protein
MVEVVIIEIVGIVHNSGHYALWPVRPIDIFGGGNPRFSSIEYNVGGGK